MKKNVVRLLFALVALLTSTSMLAENKLWIEPYEGDVMAVMLDNEPTAAALQFTVVLPDGLEMEQVGVSEDNMKQYFYGNPERLSNTHKIKSNFRGEDKDTHSLSYMCLIYSFSQESFLGSEGPIAFFKVKRNQFDELKPFEVKVEDIVMSSGTGASLECNKDFEGEIEITPEIKVTSSLSSVVVNPGSTVKVPVSFTNSVAVQGLQFDVMLPEGYVLENKFEKTDRLTAGTSIDIIGHDKDDNIYRVMMLDMSGENAVYNIGEGVIFDAFVTAPEEIKEGDAIEFGNVIASYGVNSYSGQGATIAIVNGGDAYDAAQAEIAGLQDALDEALASIAENCPDVKDDFTGEDIQKAIDDLKQAVEDAYADFTLADNYAEVMAPVADIMADIELLQAEAKAAQDAAEKEAAEKAEAERKANNEAAYKADLESLDALYASYRATVAAIQAEFPDYENVSDELKVRNNLDDAKAEIEKAYKAVAEEGEYDYKLDVEGFEASIQKLYDDAKERADGAEADRVAKNQALYDLTKAEIDKVKAEAEAALALIKEEYNNYDPLDDMRAIDAALAQAEADAKAAFDAVKDAGEYDYVFDAAAVRAMIDEMLKRAEEAGAVEGIEAEVEAGNVVIFTLDGKRHANPVHGEVNIFVRKNGKTSKVMVD